MVSYYVLQLQFYNLQEALTAFVNNIKCPRVLRLMVGRFKHPLTITCALELVIQWNINDKTIKAFIKLSSRITYLACVRPLQWMIQYVASIRNLDWMLHVSVVERRRDDLLESLTAVTGTDIMLNVSTVHPFQKPILFPFPGLSFFFTSILWLTLSLSLPCRASFLCVRFVPFPSTKSLFFQLGTNDGIQNSLHRYRPTQLSANKVGISGSSPDSAPKRQQAITRSKKAYK